MLIPGDKNILPQLRVVLPEEAKAIDLDDGHSAVQMSAHILGLWRWGVVHIAADIAVVVLSDDFRLGHPAGIDGDVLVGAVGEDDLVDVFRTQVVLRLAIAVFPVSIDKQHMVALLSAVLVEH